jgi:hypothetical protein
VREGGSCRGWGRRSWFGNAARAALDGDLGLDWKCSGQANAGWQSVNLQGSIRQKKVVRALFPLGTCTAVVVKPLHLSESSLVLPVTGT